MFRTTAFLLLSLGLSSCAIAGSPSQEVEWFRRGVYIGGAAGIADSNESESDIEDDLNGRYPDLEVTDYDDDDFAWKAYAGYRFEKPFAIEVGYASLGEVDSEIDPNQLVGPDFLERVADEIPYLGEGPYLGLFYYPLDWERVQLGLGGGVWYWEADIDSRMAGGGKVDEDEDGIDPFVGAHFLFDLTKRISVRLEYDFFWLDDYEANVFTGGLQFRIF